MINISSEHGNDEYREKWKNKNKMNDKERKENDEAGKVSNCPNGSEEGEEVQEQENGIATKTWTTRNGK